LADAVLVELATIKCAHLGSITLTGKGVPALKGLNSNVLTETSILGAGVIGCTYSVGTVPAPCTVVNAVASPANNLHVPTDAALLDSSTIYTTSPVAGMSFAASIITAGQDKLKGS